MNCYLGLFNVDNIIKLISIFTKIKILKNILKFHCITYVPTK